ncbi:hypothetical protein N482_21985 [Pseudoalteromonas luteoviolacea NCIMB 1942]|uniref:Uncharacterized protein n=1 Tax=Pseudoalteromonas luteoviolacea NCIMB 1942 TaxID=1365253 RepID=A0A167HSP5_9GAMM|nr:hypothetical protein N482_21985 [Pseudoalteromonas luteoviolacea NCIMB 1942]
MPLFALLNVNKGAAKVESFIITSYKKRYASN